jgi:hypothetical protein
MLCSSEPHDHKEGQGRAIEQTMMISCDFDAFIDLAASHFPFSCTIK